MNPNNEEETNANNFAQDQCQQQNLQNSQASQLQSDDEGKEEHEFDKDIDKDIINRSDKQELNDDEYDDSDIIQDINPATNASTQQNNANSNDIPYLTMDAMKSLQNQLKSSQLQQQQQTQQQQTSSMQQIFEAEINQKVETGDGGQQSGQQGGEWKYCCEKCKTSDKNGGRRTCVCVVPANQRKMIIGSIGCRTCGCQGCTREDQRKREQIKLGGGVGTLSASKDERGGHQNQNQFENGCCRRCMKAYSQTGKSCLCQVPKIDRKRHLGDNGCTFCGCHGCNPEDLRRERERRRQHSRDRHSYHHSRSRSNKSHRRDYHRHSRSRSYSHHHNRKRSSRSYSDHYPPRDSNKDRMLDTGGNINEPLRQYSKKDFLLMNFDNFESGAMGRFLSSQLNIFPPLLGFGIPQRTASYILGRKVETVD